MMLIKCVPDDDGCIDLLSVMRVMNQIDQEQAWALAYQLAALMQRLWPAGNNCATIESLAQICINQEGFVHEKTLQLPSKATAGRQKGNKKLPVTATGDECHQMDTNTNSHHGVPLETSNITTTQVPQNDDSNEQTDAQQQQHQQHQQPHHEPQDTKLPPTPPITPELHEQLQRRQRATSEAELVASLGIALFWTLDYGIPDDEERKLGRTMEFLIVQSQNGLTLAELEQICIERLPVATKAQADQHYRSICKALIADTIELSLLLEKIYTATMVMNGAGMHTTATVATNQAQQAVGSKNSNKNQSDIISHHHHHPGDYLHHHLLHIDQDDLSEFGLPLASLRALKINDWARLWMQVIRELRQRRKFTHQQHQYAATTTETEGHAGELQTV